MSEVLSNFSCDHIPEGDSCGLVVTLVEQNAKLRELVHVLCHCMQIKASCDDCRINGHKGELAHDPLAACDGLHKMLRELVVDA